MNLPIALKRVLNRFFNTRAAGLYIVVFAMARAAATFIDNDFGTSSAQKLVYHSWWFTLLLMLISVTIVVSVFRFRLVQQKKWALVLFHLAIVVILAGAAVTRFYGEEGIMHIREDGTSNTFLSSETFLQFKALTRGEVYNFDEPVLFASLGDNRWEGSYQVGEDVIKVSVIEFIPNPVQELQTSDGGRPTIKIVIGGAGGREEYYVPFGDVYQLRGTRFNFDNDTIANAINIALVNDSLFIRSEHPLTQRIMATQQIDTLHPRKEYYPLKLKSLYTDAGDNFVFSEFNPKGEVHVRSGNSKITNESMTALRMAVEVNHKQDTLMVYGTKGLHGKSETLTLDGVELSISYGAKPVTLPFSIKLHDFIIERYPGTNSAASYASDVQLFDQRKNLRQNYSIYMNHILNYEGYRFFQSSFDTDESGTYLSVNHDRWGTRISYLGYTLLTIGMLWSLVSTHSRFHQLIQNVSKLRSATPAIVVLMIVSAGSSIPVSAQSANDVESIHDIVNKEHAQRFSRVIVQDYNGRMKPMHTLSREVLRKLTRRESLDGISADQVVLSMFSNSQAWIHVNMINIGVHPTIREMLRVPGKLASYSNFFNVDGAYLIQEEVRKAYGMQPENRGVYEKELLRIDERVNIASMIYSGSLLKVIPLPNDPNNTWIGNEQPEHHHDANGHVHITNASVAAKFFTAYRDALSDATVTKDYSQSEKLIAELEAYQSEHGQAVLPSKTKIGAEILLNELNIFDRLAVYYTITGVALLIVLFYSVFKTIPRIDTVYRILFGAVMIGFILHTAGLGLRWYVSERAPWSNGYESMIYIAWTTLLAGVLFARKSFGGLAATLIISATVLMVAMLSSLDPEITPLVPVLKSYWLTIHVSMEAGSYGFLILGALIGLINLILMAVISGKNKERVYRQIKEMSYLSEMTLIGGLFMISVGTYLGGVWANESWGRYWGWDAKETWALVTILVYAFILHMRLIPGLQGLFAYNFATVFGLASVIMTYYGVNYYLSGLHSYAAGDPVPVPTWVFAAIVAVMIITTLAFRKKRIYGIAT